MSRQGGNPAAPDGSTAINNTRRGLAVLGCAAVIAASAAACGTVKQASAEVTVDTAFTKLEAAPAVTAGLSFDATADQLYAALKHDDDFKRSDATTLAALRVSLSLGDAPAHGGTAAPTAVRVATRDGGQAFEERTIGDTTYLRLNLKVIESFAGSSADDRSLLDGVQKSAAKLPPKYAALKTLLRGGWVSLTQQDFNDMVKGMGAGVTTGAGLGGNSPQLPSLDAKTRKEVTEAFRKALDGNAKFTDAGTSGGVRHIKVTVKAGKAAHRLAASLKPFAKQLGDPPLADLSKTPARDVTVDLGITGGTLSAIRLDLAQLDTKAVHPVPLVITLKGTTALPSAPAGAVRLDPKQIAGAMESLVMGDGGFDPGHAGTGKHAS